MSETADVWYLKYDHFSDMNVKCLIIGKKSVYLLSQQILFLVPPGAFGTLGVGGGFALGAKLCRPESEVYY